MSDNSILQKPEVLRAIGDGLAGLGIFATKTELDVAIANVIKRVATRSVTGNGFSITTAIRGMAVQRGQAINSTTRESDVRYLEQNMKPDEERALSTGSVTGSYLVPTIQANEIIQILSDAGALRRLGPRIWPMTNIEKLTIPAAAAFPTIEWLGENTAQTPSDPTFDQVILQTKTARGLVALPNELIATSSPAVDSAVTELLGVGLATKEDAAFFATTTQTGGPVSIFAASGTTKFSANANNANGGIVRYSDLLVALEKAYTAMAAPPFVWAMHPRTFFTSIHGMLDGVSRPIVRETASSDGIEFTLFGFRVVLSANMPVNQTVGSGTGQSYILFTNSKYINVGEGPIEIAYSLERYFENNQTAIRIVKREDWVPAPAAGVVIMTGVN